MIDLSKLNKLIEERRVAREAYNQKRMEELMREIEGMGVQVTDWIDPKDGKLKSEYFISTGYAP